MKVGNRRRTTLSDGYVAQNVFKPSGDAIYAGVALAHSDASKPEITNKVDEYDALLRDTVFFQHLDCLHC